MMLMGIALSAVAQPALTTRDALACADGNAVRALNDETDPRRTNTTWRSEVAARGRCGILPRGMRVIKTGLDGDLIQIVSVVESGSATLFLQASDISVKPQGQEAAPPPARRAGSRAAMHWQRHIAVPPSLTHRMAVAPAAVPAAPTGRGQDVNQAYAECLRTAARSHRTAGGSADYGALAIMRECIPQWQAWMTDCGKPGQGAGKDCTAESLTAAKRILP